MKKVKIVMYVGAALFAVYAVFNFCMGFSSYAEYIEYYGFAQVFPTIAELFFASAGWAFLLLGLGAICGHFERQEAILESIDIEEEEGEEASEEASEAEEAEEAEEAPEEAAEEPAPEKEQA